MGGLSNYQFPMAYSENSRPPALLQHIRAVHALVLRDIKTRVGASYFGLLFGLIIPLAHIGVLLAVYLILGRRSPIGTDVLIFLSSAILPFVIWSYTHQRMMRCMSDNHPLLAFPTIKLIDIAIARATVELLNSAMIVIITCSALSFVQADTFISDPHRVLLALILSYLLGVSTGLLFGVCATLFPIMYVLGFVLVPIYWMASGVFFIPDALPKQIADATAIFPLAHIVDYARTALYAGYVSDFPNLSFVVAVIGGDAIVIFLMQHLLKAELTQ